jgi:hypothetical protein
MGWIVGSLKDLSVLKARMETRALSDALSLSKSGRGYEAANALDRLVVSPEQRQAHGELLAYVFGPIV